MAKIKQNSKLFELDRETKELLQNVAAMMGDKPADIIAVWQHTIYTYFISFLESSDKNYNVIKIPFIGKILLRESKEEKGEFDVLVSLDDSFKEQLRKCKKQNMTDLISYFQENNIEKTIENIM